MTDTQRQDHPRRTWARTALGGGLVLAAAGLIVQILTGVPGFPLVPPGPIILLAAAAVVVWLRWRWAPAVGLLAGSMIQLLGLVVAILAGTAALTLTRAR